MENERLLLKGSYWSFLGSVYSLIGNYLLLFLLTKLFGYDNYGYYVLVLSITTLLSTISLFGFDGVFLYLYPKLTSSEVSSLISKSYCIIISLSGFLMILLFISSDLIAKELFNNEKLASFLRVMFLFVMLDGIITYSVAVLRGSLNIKYKVIYEQIISITFTILILTAILLTHLGRYTLFVILFIKTILACTGIILVSRLLKTTLKNHFNNFSKNILTNEVYKYALVYLSSVLVTAVYSGAAPWLIAALLDIKDVGSFDLISRISQFILFPMFIFDVTFAPLLSKLLSKNNHEDAQSIFTFSSKIISIFSLIIYVALISFYKDVINLFGKEFFYNGFIPLVILMCGKLFHSFTGSSGWVLLVSGKNKLHLFNSIVFTLSNIILNYLLIPPLGITGAAISISTSLTINKLLSTFQIKKYFNMSPFKGTTITFYSLSIILLFFSTLFTRITTISLTTKLIVVLFSIIMYLGIITYTLNNKERMVVKNIIIPYPIVHKIISGLKIV